ncbi:MAG: hypothetical protein ABFD07_15435 [Methanobacterium sp.]
MSHKPISLKEFKDWLVEQKDLGEFFSINKDNSLEDENEKYIGRECVSKVSEKKLIQKIETEEDPEEMVREFMEEGGSVISVEDKKVQVETELGSFFIPRFCVKIKKD